MVLKKGTKFNNKSTNEWSLQAAFSYNKKLSNAGSI
jgi:hypothetical protein